MRRGLIKAKRRNRTVSTFAFRRLASPFMSSVGLPPPSARSLIYRRKSTRFRAHVDYPFSSKNCYVAPHYCKSKYPLKRQRGIAI